MDRPDLYDVPDDCWGWRDDDEMPIPDVKNAKPVFLDFYSGNKFTTLMECALDDSTSRGHAFLSFSLN